MTVAELIERLQALPPGHHVYLAGSEMGDRLCNVAEVRSWDHYGPEVVVLSERP